MVYREISLQMTLFEGNYVLIPIHRGEEGEFLIRIYSEKFEQHYWEKSKIKITPRNAVMGGLKR